MDFPVIGARCQKIGASHWINSGGFIHNIGWFILYPSMPLS
jgi:hypothetical protein